MSLKPHVAIMLKKAYAKTAALRRIKRLVPLDVKISLFKAYVSGAPNENMLKTT